MLEFGVAEDRDRALALDDVGELRRRETGVEQQQPRAGAAGCRRGEHEAASVAGEQCDVVAGSMPSATSARAISSARSLTSPNVRAPRSSTSAIASGERAAADA